MNFFGNILSAAVKTATLPIAVAKDVVNVVAGDNPDAIKKHVKSIGDDLDDAFFPPFNQ